MTLLAPGAAIIAGAIAAPLLVVLIDRSAGMSARDQGGGATRLEIAKKRARELIDSVLGASGSRVMLVQFAADAQAITPMTADRAVIDEAIDAVTACDQPADID